MRNKVKVVPFLSGLAVAIAFLISWTTAYDRKGQGLMLQKRFVNSTELDACKAIANGMTTQGSKVVYPADLSYLGLVKHYITSSVQFSTCVAVPASPADISVAIKIIGTKRIRFAVEAGGHASNQGFSSTPGVLINLEKFQQIILSGDKKTVDVGPGNVWDNVYSGLGGAGVAVVGGRVTGIGVGGFITGGGGYSWLTNQYGLTGDTLVSADIVLPDGTLTTASSTENPDLFWAIRGGGNRFGIVYNFKLRTVPQGQVYGGTRTYTADEVDGMVNATLEFFNNNKDPKAQIIATFDFALGQPGVALQGFYDAPTAPADAFAAFDNSQVHTFTDDWKTRSLVNLVESSLSELQAGQRGAYHTVSLEKYSKPLLDLVVSELKYYGGQTALHSGTLIAYSVEPFLPYSQYAQDAAWPHKTNALPFMLNFGWTDPLEDEFWINAIKASADKIAAQARSEGQNLDNKYLYPNYAIAGTPPNQLYGPNLGRLSQLKNRFDPQDVMGLTTYFSF